MNPETPKPANIDFVGKNHLCTECGACWGICPKGNIHWSIDHNGQLHYRVTNHELCGACNLCISICPGIGVDFANMQKNIYGQPPDKKFTYNDIGPREEICLGRAVDKKLHRGGASGGVTTALLAYALEELKLDGVFVAKLQSGEGSQRPFGVSVFLAENRRQLQDGQQSKYTTVPMAHCLRHIIYQGRGKRFAFVGVGCQMHALRKAEQILPVLKNRIALRLGIFCGHCMDTRGTRHLLRLLKTPEDEVAQIAYRDGRWPGNFRVLTRSGSVRQIDHMTWTSYVMTLFEKWRCHFCPDPLNQFADISTGDPWLQELARCQGQNIIIPRTEHGLAVLKKAKDQKYIIYEKFAPEKVLTSQHRTLYRKRLMIRVYNRLAKLRKRPFPTYTHLVDQRPLGFGDYKQAISLELLRSLAAQRIMAWPILLFGRLFLFRRRRRLKKQGLWF